MSKIDEGRKLNNLAQVKVRMFLWAFEKGDYCGMECRSSEQDARLTARSERLRATGPIWWLSSSGALSFHHTSRDPFTLLLRRRSAARHWGAHQRRPGLGSDPQ